MGRTMSRGRDRDLASSVRRATTDDVPVLTRVLTRALDHDPRVGFTVRQDGHRARAMARMLGGEYLRRATLPHGEVYTTQDRAGAALWLPPGETSLSTVEWLRRAPAYVATCGWRRSVAALRLLRRLSALHPDEPHFHLLLAGVDPDHQGRGIGGALLRPVLDRCDAEGVPAYLEATAPGNRRWFERVGFDATDEVELGAGGPTIWPMVRAPQPPADH